MIKEFLDAIFAPGKLMRAIDELRMENARLRHELRHYTEYSVSTRIEEYARKDPEYMAHLWRRAWQRIASGISMRRDIYEQLITPLSPPELASSPFARMVERSTDDNRFPRDKLTVRVLIRTPTPMLQGVVAPCEEDPDWVIEEYALKMREKDPPDLKRPFMRISLLKRLDLMAIPSMEETQSIISRVATVRFEKDGTPYVVSR